ncbi:hypothetical protein E4656_00795 [Natronospirillum operosum]|uniref:Uncharacterized protein n=1 Tax=Natronospirillum operosum TaxID=2759953 RepID=A0A4Z0W8Q8_9GAMM|nr:hypothetical protein [Natronospirillum operosum]TGG94999.1 hypothetical protein E4656_00795 [Natronospirillum operosum]
MAPSNKNLRGAGLGVGRLSQCLLGLAVALGLLLLAADAQAPVPQQDYDYVDSYMDYRIYDLPPQLVFIKRFGSWQARGETGLHRLLVVDAGEHLARRHHLLYVQWVCHCEQGVMAMIPLSEVNRSGPFIYTRPEIRRRGQTWYMSLVAQNTTTRDISRVNVFLPQFGEYRVEYDTYEGPMPEHR